MERKTIQISPELFKMGGNNKTMKKKQRKQKPILNKSVKTNMQSRFIDKIKMYQKRQSERNKQQNKQEKIKNRNNNESKDANRYNHLLLFSI